MQAVQRHAARRAVHLACGRSPARRGLVYAAKPPPTLTPEEAVRIVRSGDRVFMHSCAAFPQILADALTDRHEELREVEICHIHVEGNPRYQEEQYRQSFRANNFFIGGNMRKAVNTGLADFVPVFLSEVPMLFEKSLPLDVAMVQVSPPDKHGFCSLGPSVDVSLPAIASARHVIAQVNKHVPRTLGESVVHVSRFNALVEHHQPLCCHKPAALSDTDRKIGAVVAELIEDGSTLQMGIGSIPDAVLTGLGSKRGLGIHTEMFAEGVIDLMEKGVVTNEHKKICPGQIVSSFLLGSQRMWEFVDDNPYVSMQPSHFVNDPAIIKQNPRVVAINSAIEVDITGQICADSIGTLFFSGIGGQMDFERGAALSPGGKPVIALTSQTNKGTSRITSLLKPGAGVVTTRANAHYVCTEYGAAFLFGKNVRERARALIHIAHPSHRERLEKEAFERLNIKAWDVFH
eukprot:TRINITY_DN5232_c0_g1_i1.p1 TRINITY_DN5232_c0_g1~~TRINITY_DN5232_c0_g1_i1.p1  ORF type:complete len:487 (+),score=129.60 TRINITY_DN5232_c0_g1_i1:80-1462(+)